MKVSEIGPHDHGFEGKVLEVVIGPNGRRGDILEVLGNDQRIMDHVLKDHINDDYDVKMERVVTDEPNSNKFLVAPAGVIFFPVYLTGKEREDQSFPCLN